MVPASETLEIEFAVAKMPQLGHGNTFVVVAKGSGATISRWVSSHEPILWLFRFRLPTQVMLLEIKFKIRSMFFAGSKL